MAIKKISANLLANNAVHTANIASGAISAADIANNSITAAKISASTSPTFGGLKIETSTTSAVTISEDTGSGVAELRFVATESYPKTKIVTDVSAGSLTLETVGSDRLNIANNGDISFYEDTGTTAKLFWDASEERLGIGTSSPTDKLHVGTSSGGTQLKIQSGSGVNNCVLHTNGTTDSWRIGMNLVLTNGSYEFYDDVNNIDRMVITSSGDVGIGTTSPASILHVEGNTNDWATAPMLYFGSTSTANAAVRDWAIGPADSNYGTFHFNVGASTGASPLSSASAVMVMTSSKNVGIGTINPDAQLEIAGASGTSSTLKLSGRPDWTSGSGQYNVGNIYGENLGAGVNTTRIKFDGDDTDGSILFQTADTGTLRSVMYMGNNGTTEVPMIRANGWWNGALNTVGGGACEIGFDGTYAAVLGYDRNASQYKYLWLDGYNVTLASNGTQRAEVNGYGITPYQDNTYDLGTEANTAYWRRSYFKGTSNTGESNGQPDLAKTSRGAIHIELPSSGSSSGITFGAGSYNPAQTQAGIVCHNNGSDGTHLGFFTTYTYSGGPYCRMKISNYGAIIGGVNVDLTSTSAPSNTTFYSTNGDITVQADNGNHYISDQLPGGYSRGQYGCMRADGSYMYFAVNNTYAAYMNSSGTLSSASDERLKENVTTLTDSLDKIKQLRGVNFTWKDENRGTENNIGFIAQEIESIYPELVGDGGLANTEDGEAPMKHVSYEKLVPALVEAIKELSDKNDALQARLDSAGL